MKRLIRKTLAFIKGIILWLRPGFIFGFLASPLLFLSNLLSLTRWIARQDHRKHFYNDFYSVFRNPSRKVKMYEQIVAGLGLSTEPIDYLEFGVHSGSTFKWWLLANKNPDSRFYGFDTFEGLPEDWGTYNKGEMSAVMPRFDDSRYTLFKGLFQNTLADFKKNTSISSRRKIIHLDADLFSSTLYVLGTLGNEIKSGDIIIFDEFCVPNHEWMAYSMFTKSFYTKMEVIGAANNYFHVAFKVI
jgi:O-methyltransferase